eukprot:scaffold364956_cov22-Prasinocladus_malaysianus.AAC.1
MVPGAADNANHTHIKECLVDTCQVVLVSRQAISCASAQRAVVSLYSLSPAIEGLSQGCMAPL